MPPEEQKPKLAAALVAAQSEMPVVPFDSTNPFHKKKYASLGAVISASRPVLAKHGLAALQMPISGQGTIGVETVMLHSSGESITSRIELPFAGEKGKSSAQEAGSIITYLKRYALTSILKMYADEDDDAQPEAPHSRPPSAPPVSQQRPDPTAGDDIPMSHPPKSEDKPKTYAKPKKATAETRKWMLGQLEVYGEERVLEYARKNKIILPAVETLKDWPLEKVVTSKEALAELCKKIEAFKSNPETPLPDSRLKVVGQIEGVKSKSGETRGKKWTMYIITLGGVDYTTFSATLGKEADESALMKETVTLFYEEKDGKKTALEILSPLTP